MHFTHTHNFFFFIQFTETNFLISYTQSSWFVDVWSYNKSKIELTCKAEVVAVRFRVLGR